MKKTILLSSLLALSTTTLAQDFQIETSAEYENNDVASAYGVFGQIYFSQVSTDGHALREAAYLEKKSSVYASFVEEDYDLGGTEQAHKVGAEFYIPKAYLFIGLQYQSVADDDVGITLGVTPVDGLRITTQYWDDVDYDLNLQAKYVTMFQDGKGINLEFSYADNDYQDTIKAGFDYYFNPTFSLGVEIEDFGETDVTVRTEKFFTDRFSARASYTFSEYEDTLGLGVAYRL